VRAQHYFIFLRSTYSTARDLMFNNIGGPLIIRGDGPESDVQVGIVSWGIGCAYLPGVFSRVSTGYDWIKETVCGTSSDPPGSLCGSTETNSE
jgi:secreted trypsin-like serine protease